MPSLSNSSCVGYNSLTPGKELITTLIALWKSASDIGNSMPSQLDISPVQYKFYLIWK